MKHYRGFAYGDLTVSALDATLAYCREALSVLSEMHESQDRSFFMASVYNSMGLAYRGQENWTDAHACFDQARTIFRALGNEFWEGHVLANLGLVYSRSAEYSPATAISAFKAALRIFRRHKAYEVQAQTLISVGRLYLQLGKQARAGPPYRRALRLVESMRADISSEEARAGYAMTVADVYAHNILYQVELGRAEAAFDLSEHARCRAFLDALVTVRADEPVHTQAAPYTAAQIQQMLPDGALLLSYFTCGEEHPGIRSQLKRHYVPPAHTLLFAVTRSAVSVIDLGLSPNDFALSDVAAPVEQHFLSSSFRRALYDCLLAPVETLINQASNLYVIPHGPLHYVPFQALEAPNGQTLLRKNGPAIVYGPSASVLFRAPPAHHADRTLRSCLAVGNNGAGGERTMSVAEDEAAVVAELTGGDLLCGVQVTRRRLLAMADRYRMLHISCHGEFDPNAPLLSALYIGNGEMLTAADIMETVKLDCELVTLSACESGLSTIRRGDELYGMVRGFMYAGARSLVVSQWRVDERSTHLLMGKFYAELNAGRPTSDALATAQLYLKQLTLAEARREFERLGHQRDLAQFDGAPANTRIFGDPYYWAGFVVIGDTRLVAPDRVDA